MSIDNTAGKKRSNKEHEVRGRTGKKRALKARWLTTRYGKAKKIFANSALA